MSDLTSRPNGSDPAAARQTLTDRVLARVNDAGRAVDLRAKAKRPRAARRRANDGGSLLASGSRTPEQIREARSLRRVFHDLGDSYREYRRRTGEPVSAEVRDAADRFRRDVSVPSLVAVAASLDQLDILPW